MKVSKVGQIRLSNAPSGLRCENVLAPGFFDAVRSYWNGEKWVKEATVVFGYFLSVICAPERLGGGIRGGGGGGGGKTSNKPAPPQGATGCSPPPTGFGILVGGQADAAIGVAKAGTALQGNVGAGLFFNSRDYVNVGAQATSGLAGRWGSHWGGKPTQLDPPVIVGAYAGYGPSITLTNAGSAGQLKGPFQTLTIDVGVGFGKGSIQIANSGNIWTISFSGGPAPYSNGIGAALNYSTTNTSAVGTHSCEQSQEKKN